MTVKIAILFVCSSRISCAREEPISCWNDCLIIEQRQPPLHAARIGPPNLAARSTLVKSAQICTADPASSRQPVTAACFLRPFRVTNDLNHALLLDVSWSLEQKLHFALSVCSLTETLHATVKV